MHRATEDGTPSALGRPAVFQRGIDLSLVVGQRLLDGKRPGSVHRDIRHGIDTVMLDIGGERAAPPMLLPGLVPPAAPHLLRACAWPLTASAAVLALTAVIGLRRQGDAPALPEEPEARAFRLSHGLLLALVIAVVLVLSAWLRSVFGDMGALATAVLVALVELHASAASIAQLSAAGGLTMAHAQWGVAALLASSAIAKTVLAFVSGNRRYGVFVGSGLIGMAVACALATRLVAS